MPAQPGAQPAPRRPAFKRETVELVRLDTVGLSSLAPPAAPPSQRSERIEPPNWVPLCPAPDEEGLIHARDGRTFYIEDPARVIERSEGELPTGIDVDHESMPGFFTEAKTGAYGHIDLIEYVEEPDAERSEPGFWGRIERWTDPGRALIEGAIFRGISPVIGITPRFDVDPESGERTWLPPALHNFQRMPALTNRPALTHPLLFSDPRRPASPIAPEAAREEPMNEEIRRLGHRLGLSGDFTPEKVAAAVDDQMVPKAEFEAQKARADAAEKALEDDRKARFEAAADAAVGAAVKAGKLQPSSREFYRQGITDQDSLDRFQAFVASQASVTTPDPADPERPAGLGAAGLSATDKKIAGTLGLSGEEFAKDKAETYGELKRFYDGEPEKGVGYAQFQAAKKKAKSSLVRGG
ncbi:MAG: phage protease [Myxococcota bacterium]